MYYYTEPRSGVFTINNISINKVLLGVLHRYPRVARNQWQDGRTLVINMAVTWSFSVNACRDHRTAAMLLFFFFFFSSQVALSAQNLPLHLDPWEAMIADACCEISTDLCPD